MCLLRAIRRLALRCVGSTTDAAPRAPRLPDIPHSTRLAPSTLAGCAGPSHRSYEPPMHCWSIFAWVHGHGLTYLLNPSSHLLQGVLDQVTGEVNLNFESEFYFTAGPIYQPPALKVGKGVKRYADARCAGTAWCASFSYNASCARGHASCARAGRSQQQPVPRSPLERPWAPWIASPRTGNDPTSARHRVRTTHNCPLPHHSLPHPHLAPMEPLPFTTRHLVFCTLPCQSPVREAADAEGPDQDLPSALHCPRPVPSVWPTPRSARC